MEDNPHGDELRFWSLVVAGHNECIIWAAGVSGTGYGMFHPKAQGRPKSASAHREAYRLYWGKIPEGKQLDHLCRVRRCVNPFHLEPVDNRINAQRGLKAKLTEEQVAQIRERHASGEKQNALAREFGVDAGHMSRVVNRKVWS